MKKIRYLRILLVLSIGLSLPSSAAELKETDGGRIFYVRQTIGDDSNNGRSPQTAWQSLSKLEEAMQAGDTAYVGPGLYREMITVSNSGSAEARITFVADTTGQHTGDPPGTVMITGADPMDETLFVAQLTTGVYVASNLEGHSLRVVEMDGQQYRYKNAVDTVEHLREGIPELEVLAKLASTYHYDRDAGTLYIHTSDDNLPSSHEIELIRRPFGIVAYESHYVSVIGFTFRHMGTSGINFGKGSSNCLALNNTSYGSWQGIRISDSTNVRVEGNTLFLNGNSGVYFLYGSKHGHAIGNISYENAKGVRWSSDSTNGKALDNVVFDNQDVGIAIESADDIHVSNNIMVNNKISQFLVSKSRYTSQENCYGVVGAEQLIAKTGYNESYETLAEFQQATKQDLNARENCGQLPKKINVHEVHAKTKAYSERALINLTASSERDEKSEQ